MVFCIPESMISEESINLFDVKRYMGMKIFKNSSVFEEEYIPNNFLYRDEEIKKIVWNLATYFDGVRPSNMYIFGPPSTGKTHTIKAVIGALNREARNLGRNIRYLYTSVYGCTIVTALQNIVKTFGIMTKNRTTALFDMIREASNNNNKYCLVIDDFDKIKPTRDYPNPFDVLLFTLSRIGSHFSVVIITNKVNLMKKLDEATKSSFHPVSLYFRNYNAVETINIIKHRCKEGFADGVIDDETISRFGAWAYKRSIDLRTIFDTFLVAGITARNYGMNKIDFEVLKRAFNEHENELMKRMLSKLNMSELLFVYAIAMAQNEKGEEVEKNIVYPFYVDICYKNGIVPLSWRHLNTYVFPNMDMQGILKSEVRGRGRGKGVATFFSVDVELDILLPTIEKVLKEKKYINY